MALVFLPNGKHLASGSDDRTICIWNISSGRIAFGPFHEHLGAVIDLAVSHDYQLLVSASEDGTIQMWDTTNWKPVAALQHTGRVKSVAFSPDGLHLVSGSVDGNIRIWDVQVILGEQVEVDRLEGHTNWVRSVAFLPCGFRVVSGSEDMTVCVWDLQTKQLTYGSLKGHNDWVLSVGISSDGNHFFSVSVDMVICVWNMQSGELEYTIGPLKTDNINDIYYQQYWPAAFIFHNKRVVCGSSSGYIYMWEDSKLCYAFTAHNNYVTLIAFSPSGESFVSGSSDGEISIWAAGNGEILFGPFKGRSAWVHATVFSPDGSKIASGSMDCTINIRSTHTGLPIGDPLHGHTDGVRSVAFSPHGEHLVSGSIDMTIRIWDVGSGQPVAIFKGHTDLVTSVAFSFDGSQIVSGSADKTIRLWNASIINSNSSPEHVGSEHPLTELPANVTKDDFMDWEMATDGWVYNTQNEPLFWVPPDLRSVLLRRHNTTLISRQGCIELDFSNARIGEIWETCYQPFPPTSKH